jgi:hypothetical protein
MQGKVRHKIVNDATATLSSAHTEYCVTFPSRVLDITDRLPHGHNIQMRDFVGFSEEEGEYNSSTWIEPAARGITRLIRIQEANEEGI